MAYKVPELVLVGSAQHMVLGAATDIACVRSDHDQTDSNSDQTELW